MGIITEAHSQMGIITEAHSQMGITGIAGRALLQSS